MLGSCLGSWYVCTRVYNRRVYYTLLVCICVCLSIIELNEHLIHSYVYSLGYTSMQIPRAYVTGFWTTNWNVILGLFHFIAPANSHTHTLPVYCCIIRLSWPVCFSRVGFVNHVKSQLRQWGPGRALDGRYGSDLHLCISEMSLMSCRLVWPMTSTSWTQSYSKQSYWKA